MTRTSLSIALACLMAGGAMAQDATVEQTASAEETTSVTAALEQVNCALGEGEVEKESAELYEIDDAVCDAGQFDIKLNGAFEIVSMTRD